MHKRLRASEQEREMDLNASTYTQYNNAVLEYKGKLIFIRMNKKTWQYASVLSFPQTQVKTDLEIGILTQTLDTRHPAWMYTEFQPNPLMNPQNSLLYKAVLPQWRLRIPVFGSGWIAFWPTFLNNLYVAQITYYFFISLFLIKHSCGLFKAECVIFLFCLI